MPIERVDSSASRDYIQQVVRDRNITGERNLRLEAARRANQVAEAQRVEQSREASQAVRRDRLPQIGGNLDVTA